MTYECRVGTEKKGRSSLLLFFILNSLFSILFSACQDAVEPGDEVGVEVGVTVTVENQDGTGIRDASVRLNPIGGFSSARRTAADGTVRYEDLTIPIVGETYEVVIDVPRDPDLSYIDARRVAPTHREGVGFTGDVIRDTIFLPCRDVRVTYRVQGATSFPCGSSRDDRFEIDFCLEDRTSDTLCTPQYTHSCPGPIDFSLPDPGIPGLDMVGLDAGGASLGSNFTVNPGVPFSICAIYTAGGPAAVAGRQITVTGTGSGTLVDRITIGVLVDSCVSCDCPPPIDPIVLRDTACVGISVDSEVDLSDIINTGDEECVWSFEVETPFTSTDLSVVQAPAPIPGGEAGEEDGMVIRFRPTVQGSVRDSVVFTIYRGQGGARALCGEKLVVRFEGFAGASGCRIDTAASTLFQGGNSPAPMTTCVGIPLRRSLVIRNTGLCPIDVGALLDNLTTSGAFEVSPSSRQIEPNDSGTFTITFNPTPSMVWPGGRGNGPGRINFQGVLRLSGDCGTSTYNLTGIADTLCRGSRVQILHEWGANNDQWYEGIVIQENNVLQYVNDNVSRGGNITGQRDLWIESIDIAGLQARICTDNSQWSVVDNRQPAVAGQTACDIATNYIGQCNSVGGSGCLDVDLWDVIVFRHSSGQCGIIWITNIADDAPVRGTPSVTAQLCYPL